MLARISSAMLIVVGVIHLLPLPGVLGAGQLARLYGTVIEVPDLIILMRHRAVMFGLLGALLVAAAFRAELRCVAYVAGFVSVVSFLAIAWSVGGYGPAVGRVVAADVVALVLLLAAFVIDRRAAA